MGLIDGLADANKREMLVADCTKLLKTQVDSLEGLSGLALKAAYAAVNGIAPTYCAGAIERLLPESFAALEPIWNEGVEKGDPVAHLTQNKARTADALLSVTDVRIQKSSNSVVKGVYEKSRNSAKKHVEDAVPGLAQVIDNYTKS